MTTKTALQITSFADGHGAFEFPNSERDVLFIRNDNDHPITVQVACSYKDMGDVPFTVGARAERATGPFVARMPPDSPPYRGLSTVEMYGDTVRVTCSTYVGVTASIVTVDAIPQPRLINRVSDGQPVFTSDEAASDVPAVDQD